MQVYCPSFRSGYSPSRIYQGSQGGETDGTGTGYPDPPVPRRLVSQSPVPGNLPTVPRIKVGGKHEQIGTYTSTGFQFCRLPVRSTVRSGPTHSGQMDHPSTEATFHKKLENLFGQAVHVSHRAPYGNIKTGMGRSPPHETHSVASEATLACPREFGKSYSNPPLCPPTSRLVARGGQYSQGSALAPPSTRAADIYRRLKRRLGRTLSGVHGKRRLVRTRKPSPHQFHQLKAVLLALKSFEHRCRDQIVLIATDNTAVVSYINKEGGMRSGSLCALLWRLLSWCHPRKIVLQPRHIPGRLSVIADKLCSHNQVIQTEWSLSQQVFHLLCSKWGCP